MALKWHEILIYTTFFSSLFWSQKLNAPKRTKKSLVFIRSDSKLIFLSISFPVCIKANIVRLRMCLFCFVVACALASCNFFFVWWCFITSVVLVFFCTFPLQLTFINVNTRERESVCTCIFILSNRIRFFFCSWCIFRCIN